MQCSAATADEPTNDGAQVNAASEQVQSQSVRFSLVADEEAAALQKVRLRQTRSDVDGVPGCQELRGRDASCGVQPEVDHGPTIFLLRGLTQATAECCAIAGKKEQ